MNLKMSKISLVISLFLGLVVCGYGFDFKYEILSHNLPMLNSLKETLTKVYEKSRTKDLVYIEWSEDTLWELNTSSFATWPLLPTTYLLAYIDSQVEINTYLCKDLYCENKIAKINLPYHDSPAFYRYNVPVPWIIDSEGTLGVFDEYLAATYPEYFTYTLTLNEPQEMYYSNTGVFVNDKEILTINSGEYYFAVFKVIDGQEIIYDSHRFVVSNTVAVKDYNSDKFNVSYNSGNITVNSQIAQNAYIKVFDINGKQVAATQLKGNSTTINMASKAKGLYIINIKGKDFNVSKKINVI